MLVLKIIGIVLLCILAFVLGLIILLLALPFRYKVIAKKTECDSGKLIDALKAEVHVTWLLHFIHLGVIYDKTADLWLKILGIKFVKKNLIGDKKKKIEEDDEFDFPDEEYFEDIEAEDSGDGKEDKNSNEAKKADKNDAAAVKKLKNNFKKPEDEDFEDTEENVENESSYESEETISDNDNSDSNDSDDYKPDIFDKIGDFFENFSEKAEGFIEKTEDFLSKPAEAADKIIDTYDYYTHLFGTKGAEISIEFLKTELIKILKSLKPKRGYVELDFASEDPEKTAKVYEIYGCVLGYLPKKSKVYIDFEDEHLYFDVWIKGNICLGYLIFHGLKILLNKRLKKFIKLLKREEK